MAQKSDEVRWFVFTIEGYSYLYNIGNGRFISSNTSSVGFFTEEVPYKKITLVQAGTSNEYIRITCDSKRLSCAPGYELGQTVRWLSNDENNSQNQTFTSVAYPEFTEEMKNEVKAKVTNYIAPVSIANISNISDKKAYYLRTARGALFYNNDNPSVLCSTASYYTESITSDAAKWAIYKDGDEYFLTSSMRHPN